MGCFCDVESPDNRELIILISKQMQTQIVYDDYGAEYDEVRGEEHAVVFGENGFGEPKRDKPRNERGKETDEQLTDRHGRDFAADNFHECRAEYNGNRQNKAERGVFALINARKSTRCHRRAASRQPGEHG